MTVFVHLLKYSNFQYWIFRPTGRTLQNIIFVVTAKTQCLLLIVKAACRPTTCRPTTRTWLCHSFTIPKNVTIIHTRVFTNCNPHSSSLRKTSAEFLCCWIIWQFCCLNLSWKMLVSSQDCCTAWCWLQRLHCLSARCCGTNVTAIWQAY